MCLRLEAAATNFQFCKSVCACLCANLARVQAVKEQGRSKERGEAEERCEVWREGGKGGGRGWILPQLNNYMMHNPSQIETSLLVLYSSVGRAQHVERLEVTNWRG